MSHRIIALGFALLGVFAFCTNAVPKSLDLIKNEQVRAYTTNEIEWGAPSLPVTSKILYREALELLDNGDKKEAVEKLHLAADLTGDYAAPLFTLARVEILQANPGFLPHLMEGIKRAASSYPSQAVLAANLSALLVFSLAGALFMTLVALLVRHWQAINHTIVEIYSRRFSFPPAQWIVGLVAVGLLLMRLGLALSIALLVFALWAYLSTREKGVIVSLVIFLSAASFSARYSNCLAPAIDPLSVTNRLALVNKAGVNEECIGLIRGITGDRYRAHKNFALGTMMYRLGLYEEAQKCFLESVSLRPDFAPAFLNLGNVYFLQGDYDKALAGYRSAVELDSTSAVAHYNIGQTYIKKMLFAQSSLWLERANILGLETYRAAHPAVSLRNPPVYEEGFGSSELWTIAVAEGKERRSVLTSEMLQPYLLFPFQWLWALFVASLAAAMIAARRRPGRWRIERCDNCGGATCPECENTQTGIRLCRDCAQIIHGLNSIKVMEALLRNKRQRVAVRKGALQKLKTMPFPGVAHTYYGRIFSGSTLAVVSAGAVGFLAWGGYYFKDPRSMNMPGSIWHVAVPLAVLAAGYLLSYLAKPPQEPRNYRILPSEMRAQEQEKERETDAAPPDPWKEYEAGKAARETGSAESVKTPEPAKAPAPDKAFAGEIEKGSRWR